MQNDRVARLPKRRGQRLLDWSIRGVMFCKLLAALEALVYYLYPLFMRTFMDMECVLLVCRAGVAITPFFE